MLGSSRPISLHHRGLSTDKVIEIFEDIHLEATEIDLSHNKLVNQKDTFWSQLWRVSLYATCIRISHNQLDRATSLPMLPMLELEILDLSHNQLQTLPDELFNWMPKLVKLRLEGNLLTSLPTSITNLRNVQSVSLGSDLGGNLIADFPPGMENLQSIQMFILCHNRLQKFPTFATNWPNIKVIGLDNNCIAIFPSLDLSQMASLKELTLKENRIIKLPARIGWPDSIQLLNLSYNKIKTFPSSFLNTLPLSCALLLAGNPCALANGHPACYTPLVTSPSLLELAARRSIQDFPIQRPLTPPICSYLSRPVDRCAFCPMRFLQPCAKVIVNRTIRGHVDIPTECLACSLACPKLRSERGCLSLDPTDLIDEMF